jgi:glucose-1-phosphate thymidylyltransferase
VIYVKGIILHGGAGTRLRPLTFTGPKQFIPVANKPISQYVLEDLVEAGITEIAIVLGDVYPEKVRDYYGDGSKFGANVTYVDQDEPRGIAHAVGLCKDFVGNARFVTYLGDNLLKGGVKKFVDRFSRDKKMDTLILLTRVKEPQRFGVAEFDDEGKLIRLIEKPKLPPSDYALAGIYFFAPVIFDAIQQLKPSWRGELEITEAIQSLLDKELKVSFDTIEGWWKDTGKPEDLLEANQLILQELKSYNLGKLEENASLTNNVGIGEGTIIHNRTTIRGPVIIGEHCEIGPNSYIGPYTSIGDNVTLINTELENSIVMNGAHIDCGKRIIDSLIGKNVEILDTNQNVPKGYKLILGDASKVTL